MLNDCISVHNNPGYYKCNSCGATGSNSSSSRCGHCGSLGIETVPLIIAEKENTCVSCGEVIPEGIQVCNNCASDNCHNVY